MTPAKTPVVVALGSNLGDSVRLVTAALDRLRDRAAGGFHASGLWQTEPVDCPPGSAPFVNAVCLLDPRPGETPESLLAILQAWEREAGRQPKRVDNESRPLDLDLIAFGQETRQTPRLILPHPRACLRRFVLGPLCEIAPDLQLPGWKTTAAQLLSGLGPGQTAQRLVGLPSPPPRPPPAKRWPGAPPASLFLLLCLLLALNLRAADTRPWEEIPRCRFVADAYSDGDSFTLRHGRSTHVFRLAGVDTPETDLRFADRVQEQADYFGISLTNAVRLGEEAAAFTREQLRRGCTVRTRWQTALGMGRAPRFYAVVLIGGTNLATELVRRGYARCHDSSSLGAADSVHATLLQQLRTAEQDARTHGRGGWDRRRFPAATAAARARLDLNSASVTELMSLPGIGSKLAQRIVQARPFRSVSGLLEVPGIGPKTYQSLTNRVFVRARPAN